MKVYTGISAGPKEATKPEKLFQARSCQFLEITCTEQYLQDCASTVDPVPSLTHDFITWTAEQETVYEEMKKYSFFNGYSYEQ